MGLFSGIGNIFKAALPIIGTAVGGPLGGAIGGGLEGLLSGSSNTNAIGNANTAEQQAIQQAISGFNTNQAATAANLNPWITGGQGAFGNELDLLGVNGNGAQGSAITALQNSPLYQSLYNNGLRTVLNNASATGGLRGGNTTNSLAQFGGDTLAQVIQQQLGNLQGVSGQGLGAATSLGQFGQQNAQSIAQLLLGSGQANAGAILGQQAVNNNTQSGLDKLFSGSGVSSQITNLLNGLTGGGGGLSQFAGAAGANNMGMDALGGLSLPSLNTTPNISIALPSGGSGLPF